MFEEFEMTKVLFLDRLSGFSFEIKIKTAKCFSIEVNEFYRNNDDFINPDLQERLVIGDDSISIFTYDIKSNFFEIRDNIGTENIFSSFSDFSSFLNEIMDSCS